VKLFPAIDLLGGRAVRLEAGDPERATVFHDDPVQLVAELAGGGADRLHVVDLDGAFDGAPTPALLERLATATSLPIQVGGGYRTLAAIETALGAGADRVMIGTAALDRVFLDRAVAQFGDALVVAVDVRDGMVAASGWTETSATPAAEHAAHCAAAGVARLLVTSTHRDGSLAGPDLELLASVTAVGLPVVAAGGIASLDDLVAVRDLGCEGAIAGSALLAGRFTLPEALAAVAG
jgi:phosphoribosylformimino-5-aminoimidazole carboxamide ribotide isomerase